MDDERQVRPGFLPPKAPGGGVPPRFEAPERAPAVPSPTPVGGGQASDRPTFVAQRTESGSRSSLAITGTAVGSVSILLLVLTIGVAYQLCILLSLMGLGFGIVARKQIAERGEGRAGQARAAIWVAGIGLAMAVIAMIVWLSLDASGYAPEDLEQWLRDQLEEQRNRQGGGSTREDIRS